MVVRAEQAFRLALLDVLPARAFHIGHDQGGFNVSKPKPEPKPDAPPVLPVSPNVTTQNGAPVVSTTPGQLRDVSGSTHDDFGFWLMRSALGNRWHPKWLSGEEDRQQVAAVIQALCGFAPRDEVEGMMAAQATSAHAASMECYRRALLPEQPIEAATQLRKQAANLSRTFMELVAALDKRHGKGAPQVFRVERVQVAPGGQAIVGNVVASAARAPEPANPPSSPAALATAQPSFGPDLSRPEPAMVRGAAREGGGA